MSDKKQRPIGKKSVNITQKVLTPQTMEKKGTGSDFTNSTVFSSDGKLKFTSGPSDDRRPTFETTVKYMTDDFKSMEFSNMISCMYDIMGRVQYRGFNPGDLYAFLLKRVGNKEFLNLCIVMACGVYMGRGTKIDKMRSKMEDKGLAIIQELRDRLGLQITTGPPKGPYDVTIPRLVAIGPNILMCYLAKGNDDRVQKLVDFTRYSFPLCFRSNVTASCIPANIKSTSSLLKLAYFFNVLMSRTITKEKMVDYRRIAEFLIIQFKSDYISQSSRIELFIQLEIIDSQQKCLIKNFDDPCFDNLKNEAIEGINYINECVD